MTGRRGRRRRKLLDDLNPLNPELNPICYLLALLGAHHFLHVSRIRVKLLTFRLLMSRIYIYIYDISRLRVKERRGYCHLKEEALDHTSGELALEEALDLS